MGKFTIKNQSVQVSAQYENEMLRIDLSYNEDADKGTLTQMNGSVYLVQDNAYCGNFSGSLVAGEDGLQYSFSGIKNLSLVQALASAIEDINSNIK